jgi:7,8-dihydropterin-6-yl-methyl-4-(beta-D-ribofuranosyl)aminobenzene 5'-phosphate synthase
MKTAFPANDRLALTIITDNYYDALRPDPPVGKRFRALPGISLHAEHGFSCLLETVSRGRSFLFMFDYGLNPIGIMQNMELLGIDIGSIDAFGLSHGHFDHWGGLLTILGYAQPGVHLYVGEEAFARRFSRRPGSRNMIDLDRLDKDAIEQQGIAEIVEVSEPVEVTSGCYLTGTIERSTDYEQGSPNLTIQRGGSFEHDHFPGEQAVVCNIQGKGLVILSGCAHAGIVNTVRHAQKISGIDKVHAVIGGFHLANAPAEIIKKTISDMKEIAPAYIIPTHCTGFEAITQFATAMPEQFILNTAGARYLFGT